METITSTTSVEAALAGAAVHILNITPITPKDAGQTSLIITFEFQYRNRGNYVWSSSIYTTPAYNTSFKVPILVMEKSIASDLIVLARDAREILEDPKDPGRYNYLYLEA